MDGEGESCHSGPIGVEVQRGYGGNDGAGKRERDAGDKGVGSNSDGEGGRLDCAQVEGVAFDDFGADGMPDLNLMGIDGEFSLKTFGS